MLMNMENNDTIDLGTLKYADLRKLAKKHGIKANMKVGLNLGTTTRFSTCKICIYLKIIL